MKAGYLVALENDQIVSGGLKETHRVNLPNGNRAIVFSVATDIYKKAEMVTEAAAS